MYLATNPCISSVKNAVVCTCVTKEEDTDGISSLLGNLILCVLTKKVHEGERESDPWIGVP